MNQNICSKVILFKTIFFILHIYTGTQALAVKRHTEEFSAVENKNVSDNVTFILEYTDNNNFSAFDEFTANDSATTVCNVSLESYALSERKFCEMELFKSNNTEFLWPRVFSNQNKLVLLTSQNNETGFSIHFVDMQVCKKMTKEILYGNDTEKVILQPTVIYEDRLDVILKGKSFTDRSRITYDSEGNKISGPVPFNVSLKEFKIKPIISSSPDKGFIVLGYEHNNFTIKLKYLNEDSKETLIVESETNLFHLLVNDLSLAHGHIGACWMKDINYYSHIQCVQFDKQFKMKFNVTFNAAAETIKIDVQNLVDGGIFVMSSIQLREKCNKSCNYLNVTKVYENGHVVRLHRIPLDSSNETIPWTLAHFVETADDLCYYFTRYPIGQSLQYQKKCISKHCKPIKDKTSITYTTTTLGLLINMGVKQVFDKIEEKISNSLKNIF